MYLMVTDKITIILWYLLTSDQLFNDLDSL